MLAEILLHSTNTNEAATSTLLSRLSDLPTPFSMRVVPTLKPKHFDGLTTIVDGGLHFEVSLNVDDWIAHCCPMKMDNTSDAWEARLRILAAKRRPARTELNPRTLSGDALLELCRASQRKLRKRDQFNAAYGLSRPFQRRWEADPSGPSRHDWRKREGQNLVLVATDAAGVFVGYAAFGAYFYVPFDRSRTHSVQFDMEMVYVLPEHRGAGFGLDLSIATGMVCESIFQACYRAVPAHSGLRPGICADYHSKGGEAFTRQVSGEIDVAVDMLREERRRPSISVSHTELDAGY
jgi:GNAT superfamily N-acetyltransferase